MSRCFPFPPPGFEKATRTERLDLLDKDKHKEKKHKKEKKDKEKDKREGREKKDKERSKDKHKDKKDRKEKHKDRKKDKDKEKSSASEERIGHGEVGESSRRSQGIKESKYKEELASRIQDDKEAASRPVEPSACSIPRSHEGSHSARTWEKEKVEVGRIPPNFANTTQRNDGIGVIRGEKGTGNQPAEYFNSSAQRGPESSSTLSKDKERVNAAKLLPNSTSSSKKGDAPTQRINIANISVQRRTDGSNSEAPLRKDTILNVKLPPSSVHSMRTENGRAGRPSEIAPTSVQRFDASKSTAADPRMERAANNQRINDVNVSVQKRIDGSKSGNPPPRDTVISVTLPPKSLQSVYTENGRVVRPSEAGPASAQRFDAPKSNAAVTGMERATNQQRVASPSITIRRPNGIGRPLDSVSISTQRKSEAVGAASAATVQGSKLVLDDGIRTEQKQSTSTPSFVENIGDGRAERTEKVKIGTVEDGKREKDRSSDRHEKKRKEKDKHKKKKEKETRKEKGESENRGNDELRVNDKKVKIDNMELEVITPLILPSVDQKVDQADKSSKKRKDHEINGFLQNNDLRPTKVSRTDISNIPVENGSASHMAAAPLPSIKPEPLSMVKSEKALDIKADKINGKQEPECSSAADPRPRNSVDGAEHNRVRARSPHPDTKYLKHIYAIPEALHVSESDEQEWLFDRDCSLQKPKSGLEVDGTTQVWSQPLIIESADVIALPYVIPF